MMIEQAGSGRQFKTKPKHKKIYAAGLVPGPVRTVRCGQAADFVQYFKLPYNLI